MIKLAEGETVFINATVENEFKITAAELEAAITPKTKLFMFSSPCNPTGSVYSKEELASLVKVFEKHPNIFIISDEIYEHINFVGQHASIAEFESVKDRVIVINGFSKSYAMTGWRVGYMAANKEIASACDKLQGQITSGTSSIAQRAALAGYQGGLETVNEMVAEFKKRRNIVYALLKEIPGVKVNLPAGAFYFFPEVKSYFGKKNGASVITNAEDLCLYILNEAHVSTVTGEAFGNADCIRISYAASEDQLRKAVSRIAEALAKLN
jgi:aspartate aminotransferase